MVQPVFQNYRSLIDYNFELTNQNSIVVECIRQWLIVIGSPVLIAVLIRCYNELRAFQRSINLEQVIMLMEIFKLAIELMFTFLVLDISGYLFCIAIESSIRAVISGAFLANVCARTGNEHNAKQQVCLSNRIIYTATMLLILVTASVLSLCPPPLGANCNQQGDWHWKTLIYLDSIQTLLMLVLAAITCHLKKKQDRQFTLHPYFDLDDILSSNANTKRFESQVCIMTVFYIFTSLVDFVTSLLVSFDANDDFLCYDSKYIIVLTNMGASYIMIYNLVSFAYTLIMIFTFYYLPKRSGLVIQNSQNIEIDIEKNRVSKRIEDMQAEAFISVMIAEQKFETRLRNDEGQQMLNENSTPLGSPKIRISLLGSPKPSPNRSQQRRLEAFAETRELNTLSESYK